MLSYIQGKVYFSEVYFFFYKNMFKKKIRIPGIILMLTEYTHKLTP